VKNPRSQKPSACRRAFTLVELLVVVAIIGILAALLLPVLGQGKARARSAQCLSQLEQWSRALQMYVNDNAEYLPRRGQGVRPLTQLDRPEDWFNALPPELSLPGFGAFTASAGTNANSPPQLFVCPEAKPASGRCFLTYAMNMYVSPWNLPQPHRMDQIPTPSTVVFLSDGGIGYSSAFPAVAEYSPQARHRRTANLVFLDGHAASFRAAEIGCNTGIIQRPDVIWQFDTNTTAFSP
jgi:prepilin-type N-terminal cleavage/methylation domain-containing protein/prepilin-type processing-associated H-X9-DG protein